MFLRFNYVDFLLIRLENIEQEMIKTISMEFQIDQIDRDWVKCENYNF